MSDIYPPLLNCSGGQKNNRVMGEGVTIAEPVGKMLNLPQTRSVINRVGLVV